MPPRCKHRELVGHVYLRMHQLHVQTSAHGAMHTALPCVATPVKLCCLNSSSTMVVCPFFMWTGKQLLWNFWKMSSTNHSLLYKKVAFLQYPWNVKTERTVFVCEMELASRLRSLLAGFIWMFSELCEVRGGHRVILHCEALAGTLKNEWHHQPLCTQRHHVSTTSHTVTPKNAQNHCQTTLQQVFLLGLRTIGLGGMSNLRPIGRVPPVSHVQPNTKS